MKKKRQPSELLRSVVWKKFTDVLKVIPASIIRAVKIRTKKITLKDRRRQLVFWVQNKCSCFSG
jgi:hypothetical protein